MLYSEFIHEVMKLVIVDDDESSGFSYLEPHYRALMVDSGFEPAKVTDRTIDWDYVAEVQKLEVERRNKITDKTRFVIDWVFDVISSTIEPTMIQEENELMKNMMDYMKLNHELRGKEQALQEREANLDHKEEVLDKKDNILQLVPGMNFSKRGAK